MVLTNAFIGFLAGQIALYMIFLHEGKSKQRKVLDMLVGGGGIILIGFSYVLIGDTIEMFIMMGISLLIGGWYILTKAVPKLGGN